MLKKGMINFIFVELFAQLSPFFAKNRFLTVEMRNHDCIAVLPNNQERMRAQVIPPR